MEFREYKDTDLHAVMDLFYVTVHEVNKNPMNIIGKNL